MSDPENDPAGDRNARAPGTDTSDLAARIAQAQRARAASSGHGGGSRQGDMSGLARGLRLGTEFVAAILVGTGIGYLIDRVAGTGPWAMLAFFMLGFAAGILNVTRVVAELNAGSAAPSPKRDDTAGS